MHACIPTCLPAYLPTCLPAYLPTYIHTYGCMQPRWCGVGRQVGRSEHPYNFVYMGTVSKTESSPASRIAGWSSFGLVGPCHVGLDVCASSISCLSPQHESRLRRSVNEAQPVCVPLASERVDCRLCCKRGTYAFANADSKTQMLQAFLRQTGIVYQMGIA